MNLIRLRDKEPKEGSELMRLRSGEDCSLKRTTNRVLLLLRISRGKMHLHQGSVKEVISITFNAKRFSTKP